MEKKRLGVKLGDRKMAGRVKLHTNEEGIQVSGALRKQ